MTMHTEDRGDTFVRCHGPFEAGFVYRGHRHWIDHQSYVHPGTRLTVRYRHRKDGAVVAERTYEGPCEFLVAAGVFHEIEILTDDGRWDCIFRKPEPDSAVADVYHKELLD